MSRIHNLTPNQYRFLTARLDADSDADAAGVAGVTPSTVCHWKKQPAFLEAYNNLFVNEFEARLRAFEAMEFEAFKAYLRGLKARDVAVAARQARDWYDRSGVVRGEERTVEVGGRLAELLEKAKDSREEGGEDGKEV